MVALANTAIFPEIDHSADELFWFVEWHPFVWSRAVRRVVGDTSRFVGKHVLEIGYRAGRMSCYFALLGARVDAVDLADCDPTAPARLARQLGVSERAAFGIYDGNLASLEAAHWDFVFTKSVLVVLPQETACAAIRRLLVPGGQYLGCENKILPFGLNDLRRYKVGVTRRTIGQLAPPFLPRGRQVSPRGRGFDRGDGLTCPDPAGQRVRIQARSYVSSTTTSGWSERFTGQHFPAFTSFRKSASPQEDVIRNRATSFARRRGGSDVMCFSIVNSTPSSGIPLRVAKRDIVVATQAASDAVQRSVGEKRLPSPPLSFGATVPTTAPEGPWTSSVAVGEVSLPVMRTLMAPSYDARSTEPVGDVELGEEPVDRVRERTPVRRDPDGRDFGHSRPVGRRDLAPERGHPRGDVDAVDPDRQAQPAPDERRAAVRAPEEDLVSVPDAGERTRRAAVDRKQADPPHRVGRRDEPAVRRRGEKIARPFRRDRPRRRAADLLDEEPDAPALLVPRDQHAPAVGEKARPVVLLDRPAGDEVRLSGPGRQQEEPGRGAEDDRDRPFPIRGERRPDAVAEPDGRRAVGPAEIDARRGARPFPFLVEEQLCAVGGQVLGSGAVEPGEVAFLRSPGPRTKTLATELSRVTRTRPVREMSRI